MNLLITKDDPVLIQGLGQTGKLALKLMLEYGTKIVGATSKNPNTVDERTRIFKDVFDAKATSEKLNHTFICVPPLQVKPAVEEAVKNDIKNVIILTENVPLHDVDALIKLARASKTNIIGTGSIGLINPENARIGLVGGEKDNAEKI